MNSESQPASFSSRITRGSADRKAGVWPRHALPGLLVRRECWCLSATAKLIVAFGLVTVAALLLFGMQPFLAISRPVSHEILVVEGWMPPYIAEEVAELFRTRKYRGIIVPRALHTGVTRYETGAITAEYLVETLVKLGVPRQSIHVEFFEAMQRWRTYESAKAVRNWLQKTNQEVNSIDVVTLGPHARRSRLLFEIAFGRHLDIGVIALEDDSYDATRWWKTSAGIREVPFEFLAYLHTKLFFRASD
jgi:hypothetical protein